jgi:uracil-DNA glycosylase
MIKVIFVGDKPSSKNLSIDIPFVGASCFPRLINWIKFISPDYYLTFNSQLDLDLNKVAQLEKNNFKVIALGNNAHKKLKNCGINHFTLPHPSGLNRKINDDNYIKNVLQLAKQYVRLEK